MVSSNENYDFLDAPINPGDLGKLGSYRVIDELGRGGMGYVFRAEDTKLKRTVALKVMNRKVAGTPHARRRFISEARAMAAVHHDNVATIFEVGEHGGTPFMAMEMLKGGTLEKFKKSKELPEYQTILRIAREMACGLSAAHEQGIVHRDIKPANIWVEDQNDRIKILDFGLALAQSPVDRLSGRGSVIGTPGYLSPEQARSEPLDDRSDLYSLGVVLYELATGKLPLQSKTVAGQLIAILAHSPQPIREINPSIPEPLADLIQQLLRKEPRNRIRSAGDLVDRLGEVETECESKSEVALAINKLQAGLEQVVQKKKQRPRQAPVLKQPTTVAPLAADPFANLPGPSAVTNPAGSSPSLPAVPVAKSRPVNRKSSAGNRKSKATQSRSSMPVIIGAAVVLGLLLVGGIAYVVINQDSQDQAEVAFDDSGAERGSNSPGNAAENRTNDVGASPGAGVSEAGSAAENSRPTNPASNNRNFSPPIKVSATRVSSIDVANAVALMDSSKANGSFEDTRANDGNAPLEGDPGSKKRVRGWTSQRKGKAVSGWRRERRGASHGSVCAFVLENSLLELTSDNLKYKAREGDRFRIVADVGGVNRGGIAGKARYKIMIGFRSPGAKTGDRFLLGDVESSRDANRGMETIGYEYQANAKNAGKHPFVKLVIYESNSERRISYLDNVRVAVIPAGPPTPQSSKPQDRLRSTQPMDSPSANQASSEMTSPGSLSSTGSEESVRLSQQSSNQKPEPVDQGAESSGPQVTISSLEGDGADSTVKKTASVRDSFGTQDTLVIQARNGVDLQHSYLRFDLSAITDQKSGNGNDRFGRDFGGNQKPKERKVSKAILVLHCPDGSADGAKIRLYGATNQESLLWAEEGRNVITWKKSFSASELQGLKELATEQLVIKNNQVRITSPELANFIRTLPLKSVTLVIAGQNGNRPVQFSSRESGESTAPKLIVQ